MDQANEKFLSVQGTTRLLINNVSVEDEGYYSCVVAFAHNGTPYNVTRNIKLRIDSKCSRPRYPSVLPSIIST